MLQWTWRSFTIPNEGEDGQRYQEWIENYTKEEGNRNTAWDVDAMLPPTEPTYVQQPTTVPQSQNFSCWNHHNLFTTTAASRAGTNFVNNSVGISASESNQKDARSVSIESREDKFIIDHSTQKSLPHSVNKLSSISGLDNGDLSKLPASYTPDRNRVGCINMVDSNLDSYVFQVGFKRFKRNYLLSSSANISSLQVSEFVQVEADRGYDVGLILCITPKDLFLSKYSGHRLKKRILRCASTNEIEAIQKKAKDEDEILRVCRQKVIERNLNMSVVDVEFQYDRHKLTCFYESEGRVDFRDFVRDLFTVFKTRIWMQHLEPAHRIPCSAFLLKSDSLAGEMTSPKY